MWFSHNTARIKTNNMQRIILIIQSYSEFIQSYMSRDARKPVFRVSDQVRHKPSCTATEVDEKFEVLDLTRRGIALLG